MKKKAIVENDKAKIEQVIAELDEKKNEALKKAFEKVNIVSNHAISHFPIENRKASMDCLEGQSKMAENYKG